MRKKHESLLIDLFFKKIRYSISKLTLSTFAHGLGYRAVAFLHGELDHYQSGL